jgi:hypothetical protein
MDPTTVEFLSLHRCVDFYIDTMKLFDIYMDKLNINVHMVKYEVLIGSFEEETRKICQFLDLPWAPGMDQVASRASMVATPSSSQLALGLNFESIGHWRCYREQVAPELQRLAPWVERFGYPLA